MSLEVSSLFCIMAEEKPILVKMLKKLIITVATAMTPKSPGCNKRAKTAITIKEIMILEYLATAV